MRAPQTHDVWAPATGLRYPNPRSVQFVSADDFLKFSLQAHLAACRELVPPPGQRFVDAEFDLAWSSPEDFMRELLRHLGDRRSRGMDAPLCHQRSDPPCRHLRLAT